MSLHKAIGTKQDTPWNDGGPFQAIPEPVGMGVTGPVSASSPSPLTMGSSSRSISCAYPNRIYTNNGYEFTLHQISDSIDAAYNQLYMSMLAGDDPDWHSFRNATREWLAISPSVQAMDGFFEVAEPISSLLVNHGQLETACRYWSSILDAVISAENAVSYKYHKGSGYYFWACTLFSRGDIETALLLTHEALAEDKLHRNPRRLNWPGTSADLVISLNNDISLDHPASHWINEQVTNMDSSLSSANSGITASEMRSRFFMQSDPASVFLFVYANAALVRIESINPCHRDNAFVGRLALGYLFHIAVVLENALKCKTGIDGLMERQIKELSDKKGGILKKAIPGQNGKQYAWDINDQANRNPDSLLRSLLSDTPSFYVDRTAIPTQDIPLCIAYALRNLGGHCLDAPSVVAEKLHDLRVQMLSALAAGVLEYYP
jgi:hypothetical protein